MQHTTQSRVEFEVHTKIFMRKDDDYDDGDGYVG